VLDPTEIGESPPRHLRVRRRGGSIRSLHALVRDRSLVWALTRRDFAGRYKQTALGLGWAVLMPLATVTVFALFVQRVARADTHGAPYVLWAYLGLIPWAFFSSSISAGGQSLLSNQSLLNKLYTTRPASWPCCSSSPGSCRPRRRSGSCRSPSSTWSSSSA
jgi:hypothetical protein